MFGSSKKTISQKFAFRIAYLLLIAVVLVLTVISPVYHYQLKQSEIKRYAEEVEKYANEINGQLEVFQHISNSLQFMLEEYDYTQANRQEVCNVLKRYFEQYRGVCGVFVGYKANMFDNNDEHFKGKRGHDDSGRFLANWNRYHGVDRLEPLVGVDTAGWYQGSITSKVNRVIEPISYEGMQLISFINPIRKQNHESEIIGITGCDVSLYYLDYLAEQIKLGENDYSVLISNSGVIMSHPSNSSLIGNENILHSDIFGMDNTGLAKDISSGNNAIYSIDDPETGEESVLFCTPIKVGNFALVTVVPESEIIPLLALRIGLFLVILLLIALVIYLAGWHQARKLLLKPLDDLVRYADSVEQNKIEEMELNFNNQGEVYRIARTLKKQIDQKNEIIQSLQDSKKKLDDYIERSPNGVITENQFGQITYVNKRAKEILGITIVSASMNEISSIMGIGKLKAKEMMESKSGYNEDFSIHLKNGKYITVVPLEIFSGQTIYYLREITKSIVYEKQLIQAKEEAEGNYKKNLSLINSIPDIIMVLDNQGTYLEVYANNPEDLVLPKEYLEGRLIQDVLDKKNADLTMSKIRKVLKTRKVEQYEYELEINGTVCAFETRMSFVDYTKVLAIIRNVTEAKQKESELKDYRQKLEEIVHERTTELTNANKEIVRFNKELYQKKDKLKETIKRLQETQSSLIEQEKMASIGVLTAGIAHEINNPINFISSNLIGLKKMINRYTDFFKAFDQVVKGIENPKLHDQFLALNATLKRKESKEALLVLTKHIQTGVQRAVEIINGMKNVVHLDKETMELVDINNLIDSVLVILNSKYKYNISIHKDYAYDRMLYCYPGKLNQVIMNIIQNAIDAISNKGIIIIKTLELGDKVGITISNNGERIPGDLIKKIFDPFFTTKKIGKGTGLGLYISYNIIKEHKGDIQVNSNDTLTEFLITLPNKLK